ncbi:hypothetical protein K6U49_08585 [Vibrio alginolyticus]|uniref:hypothetical protein n=1 Tax=Vibrio alginolyticus TaxID=663 RepID=UPI001EEA35A3|nr:hypothetical protein [Vibrio alginolyticus]MCG6308651.1 hypothetical protein [Vibrio alginolyticus]
MSDTVKLGVTRERFMFVRAIFTVLSCSAPFIVISDNVPNWVTVLAWVYILGMMVVGVMALKTKQIIAWCDKQLAKKNDKNAP